MRFVIVTGVSGAGKTSALKMLEDAKYFCVDNLPIPFGQVQIIQSLLQHKKFFIVLSDPFISAINFVLCRPSHFFDFFTHGTPPVHLYSLIIVQYPYCYEPKYISNHGKYTFSITYTPLFFENKYNQGFCHIHGKTPRRILPVNRDRKSTRLNSSHIEESRMPSSA